jgi:hypothetical protein
MTSDSGWGARDAARFSAGSSGAPFTRTISGAGMCDEISGSCAAAPAGCVFQKDNASCIARVAPIISAARVSSIARRIAVEKLLVMMFLFLVD